MNHAISVELQFFLVSVLWGAILLFVYDILRIIRRLIKHDTFFVALEDLIFWVCASLFIFAMMYQENDGIIRGFSVMGMAIGMLLYHYLLSDFFITITTKFIQLLISPVVFVMNKMKKIIKFMISKGKTASNFLLRRLKKWAESVKITLNKRRQKTLAKKQLRSKEKSLKKQKQLEKKNSEQEQLRKKQTDIERLKKEQQKKQTGKKQSDKKDKKNTVKEAKKQDKNKADQKKSYKK